MTKQWSNAAVEAARMKYREVYDAGMLQPREDGWVDLTALRNRAWHAALTAATAQAEKEDGRT